MRVGLCSADADVAQHFLDHPYICPVVKQMGGKRMSNKLGIHVDADLEPDSHDYISHGRSTQRLAAN